MQEVENTTNVAAIDGNNMLCPLLIFRFFIRKNYQGIEVSNEDCDELNIQFSDYLKSKCDEKQLSNFFPKKEFDVILNSDNPLKVNGFHPAFFLHFSNFIKEQKELLDAQS